jgi:hypothetical protein
MSNATPILSKASVCAADIASSDTRSGGLCTHATRAGFQPRVACARPTKLYLTQCAFHVIEGALEKDMETVGSHTTDVCSHLP